MCIQDEAAWGRIQRPARSSRLMRLPLTGKPRLYPQEQYWSSPRHRAPVTKIKKIIPVRKRGYLDVAQEGVAYPRAGAKKERERAKGVSEPARTRIFSHSRGFFYSRNVQNVWHKSDTGTSGHCLQIPLGRQVSGTATELREAFALGANFVFTSWLSRKLYTLLWVLLWEHRKIWKLVGVQSLFWYCTTKLLCPVLVLLRLCSAVYPLRCKQYQFFPDHLWHSSDLYSQYHQCSPEAAKAIMQTKLKVVNVCTAAKFA